MNHAKMLELKEKVRTGTNFGEIIHFFMDHFGENQDFLALGEGVRDSKIETVISYIGAQLFKGKSEMTNLFLVRVAEQRFIHGGLMLNGLLCTVIYFEEMDKGLLAIADLPPKPCQYCRFTLAQLPASLGTPPRVGKQSAN